MEMLTKESAVGRRREQIDRQLAHLRARLAGKSRKQFTSDFRYRSWLKSTTELIDELIDESSALDDPGEYDELPLAVIADELGLSLNQVKRLVVLGEIETTGTRAHRRVERAELCRLARLGSEGLLDLSRQGVEHIFEEAVRRLKAGDDNAAERAYNRIKARETCVGNHALTLEITLSLVRGGYEDAERAIKFVLRERHGYRGAICFHLTQALRGVCFQRIESKKQALALLKMLDAGGANSVEFRPEPGSSIELTALYVATAVRSAIRAQVAEHLPPERQDEFFRLIGDGAFTALYAMAHADICIKSMSYMVNVKCKIPHLWEPPQLLEEFGDV
jgi:hypothetical protein